MTEEPIRNEQKAEDSSIIIGGMKVTDPIHDIWETDDRNKDFDEATSRYEINDQVLPALDLEQYEPHIEEETGVADESKGSTRFAWIGVGKSGGRLVKSFYNLGYRKVLAIDTSRRDLHLLGIPKNQKFLIGIAEEDTDREMERGRKAIQQHKQNVLNLTKQIFGTKVDHIMICFGAGGGTGSGSVGELIEVAKRYARYARLGESSNKVGVVTSLPVAGKVSAKVIENAHKVTCELSKMAMAGKISPLIIVDNDKINRMYSAMPSKSLWPNVNKTVAGLFNIFNVLSAYGSQYTSFDPLDYRSIMQAGGCAIMSLTIVDELDEPSAISEAVQNIPNKMLFASGFDLSTAKEVGCIVIGGKKLMTNVKGLQDKINYAFDVLGEMTGQATIRRGIYEDNKDSLRVYTIISGLDSPTARLEELKTEFQYRANVFNIKGPPLRQRKEDILPLAEYCLAKAADFYNRPYKTLSSDSKQLLLNYPWPGDVRELAKAMKRAHELTIGQEIQPDALPFEIIFADSATYPKDMLPKLEKVKRKIIIKALELFRGRQDSVTRILGIEPSRLNHLIKKLNISVVKKNTGG